MKNLPIDRKKIEKCFVEFDPNGSFEMKPSGPNGHFQLKYSSQSVSTALIALYYNSDGTVTLNPKIGKNQEISTQLAQHIINECSYPKITDSPLSLKITNESLKELLEFVELHENKIELTQPIQYGTKYILKGEFGDQITLTHFNTGTLLIQGGGLLLKTQIVLILTDYLPYKEVIDLQLKIANSTSTPDEVISDLQCKMTDIFPFLGEKLIAIMSPSQLIYNFETPVPDYSFLVFPMLRGLEGVIKKLFLQCGIEITEDFGYYYDKDGETYKINDSYASLIKKHSQRKSFEDLYNFYHRIRHNLFHVDGTIETTKTIDNKLEAISLIENTILLINKSFQPFSK